MNKLLRPQRPLQLTVCTTPPVLFDGGTHSLGPTYKFRLQGCTQPTRDERCSRHACLLLDHFFLVEVRSNALNHSNGWGGKREPASYELSTYARRGARAAGEFVNVTWFSYPRLCDDGSLILWVSAEEVRCILATCPSNSHGMTPPPALYTHARRPESHPSVFLRIPAMLLPRRSGRRPEGRAALD